MVGNICFRQRPKYYELRRAVDTGGMEVIQMKKRLIDWLLQLYNQMNNLKIKVNIMT